VKALAIVLRLCEALQYAHERVCSSRSNPENLAAGSAGPLVKIAGLWHRSLIARQPRRDRPGGKVRSRRARMSHRLECKARAGRNPRATWRLKQNPRPIWSTAGRIIYSWSSSSSEMLTGSGPYPARSSLPLARCKIDVRLDQRWWLRRAGKRATFGGNRPLTSHPNPVSDGAGAVSSRTVRRVRQRPVLRGMLVGLSFLSRGFSLASWIFGPWAREMTATAA
jgi:hypothetical protein